MLCRLIALATLFATLASTACSSPMKTPDIKLNPHPKQRHEITLTVNGTPAAFDSVQASAFFEVKNDNCFPLQPISGAHIPPQKIISIPLSKSGNTYRGDFYADQIIDEDYFKMGTCHWHLVSIGAYFDAPFVTDPLSIGMYAEEIISEKHVIQYFPLEYLHGKRPGPRDPDNWSIETGVEKNAFVTEHPEKFFSISITGKETSQ